MQKLFNRIYNFFRYYAAQLIRFVSNSKDVISPKMKFVMYPRLKIIDIQEYISVWIYFLFYNDLINDKNWKSIWRKHLLIYWQIDIYSLLFSIIAVPLSGAFLIPSWRRFIHSLSWIRNFVSTWGYTSRY